MPRRTSKRRSWSENITRTLRGILKDHFIPHAGNNHVPHVLHHRALFGYSVIVILLKVLVLTVAVSFPAASLYSSAITPGNIVTLTNETREGLGLPDLAVDDKLMQAAQAKAEDMLINGYFAHTSPSGLTPWYWFKTYGYNYRSAGENLAAHFTEAEDVEAGWMASPTHRANIVSDRYDEIGVGVVNGMYEGYNTTFVVQMFGYELDDQTASNEIKAEVVTTPQAIVTSATPAPEPTPTNVSAVPEDTGISEPTADSPILAQEPDAADPHAMVIDTSTLALTPIASGYSVTVHMQNVNEAVLYLGDARVPLVHSSDDPNVWQSVVLYDQKTMSSDGERLSLVAGNVDGDQKIVDLAWIMPGTTAPQVYAFKGAGAPRLLGVMDLANIDDSVQKFYIFTLLFLSGALLIAIFVKIEVQRPSMVAHSLAVIMLTALLTII